MNNINPVIWGNYGWKFLHYITFAYPDNPTYTDKENYSIIFKNIGKVLPCEKCQDNYYLHLQKYPLDAKALSSRYNLVNWLINVHNEVNKMNNKPIITFNQAVDIYLNNNSPLVTQTSNNTLFYLIIIILIIIILVLLYKLNNKQ